MTSRPKATLNNQVIRSPLLRFRKRANCKECTLHDACLSDKNLETRCILALIADNLHAQLEQSLKETG